VSNIQWVSFQIYETEIPRKFSLVSVQGHRSWCYC